MKCGVDVESSSLLIGRIIMNIHLIFLRNLNNKTKTMISFLLYRNFFEKNNYGDRAYSLRYLLLYNPVSVNFFLKIN